MCVEVVRTIIGMGGKNNSAMTMRWQWHERLSSWMAWAWVSCGQERKGLEGSSKVDEKGKSFQQNLTWIPQIPELHTSIPSHLLRCSQPHLPSLCWWLSVKEERLLFQEPVTFEGFSADFTEEWGPRTLPTGSCTELRCRSPTATGSQWVRTWAWTPAHWSLCFFRFK